MTWLPAVAVLAALVAAASAQQHADVVVRGGPVWTGAQPREVRGFAVVGDRIAAVGGDLSGWIGAGTEVVELGERRVVPGFIDAHVHFLDGGDELLGADLRDARTVEEFARRLGESAARFPAGTWITSGTWDHENWPDAALPTAAVLDRHVSDHPVFVSRLDGHMAVANSLAMRLAGVTAEVETPDGGWIDRGEDGRPRGVFKDAAMALIAAHVPEWTAEQRLDRARAALAHAAALGVTGVHDMLASFAAVETYQELRARGELTLRVTLYTPLTGYARWAAARVRRGFGDEWVKVNGSKGFADGSLGSTTALFFEPYLDRSDTTGLAQVGLEPGGLLETLVRGSAAAGLQPAIHSIGDRAIRCVLDVFERGDYRALRPRIEHAQHVHPDDLGRFAVLDVVASMQPYHAIDDGRWAEKRIGAERCATTYAFRSLLDRGARLAFGSDWPVAPLSPMLGVYAAVTRRTLDGEHPDGWVPAQKITLDEAIAAYTAGGAFAAFDEVDRGTIEVGKLADFAILDVDPWSLPPARLREVGAAQTWVGGRRVHPR